MASGQNPQAKVKLYAVTPDGNETRIFQGVNEQTGPGGSPDGVQATVKANELPQMAGKGNVVITGGRILKLKTELVTADGVDASDCVVQVPIFRNGNVEYLSASDFGFSTDLPAGSLAGINHELGTGYTVPEGDKISLAVGEPYFISIENDTA